MEKRMQMHKMQEMMTDYTNLTERAQLVIKELEDELEDYCQHYLTGKVFDNRYDCSTMSYDIIRINKFTHPQYESNKSFSVICDGDFIVYADRLKKNIYDYAKNKSIYLYITADFTEKDEIEIKDHCLLTDFDFDKAFDDAINSSNCKKDKDGHLIEIGDTVFFAVGSEIVSGKIMDYDRSRNICLVRSLDGHADYNRNPNHLKFEHSEPF